jgi:CRP-like cAMP-binding protein
MDPRGILRSTPFFAEVLDAAELDLLAAHSHLVSFPKGATPIEEDGPGHAMFVIASGEAKVTIAGDDEPVATLKAGDIVGEMSLLTGARRSATVTAATSVDALEISKQALARVLEHSPDLVDRFVAMITRRQRQLDHLAGGNAWGMMRLGKGELAGMIRAFFGAAR